MKPGEPVLNSHKTGAIERECTPETPAFYELKHLPLAVAKQVYIYKQGVLEQALQSLSLKMHEAKTCIIGDNEIIASVCIDVPAHGQYPLLHKRSFFGDYKLTETEALESANLAALLYLQKQGIIVVDDINSSELATCQAKLEDCQHKLLVASTWANMFQESAASLQDKLTIANQQNQELLAAAKEFSIKKELSTPPTTRVKEEVFTPPSSHGHAGDSSSQYKKCRIVPNSSVRKPLFQGNSATHCEGQKSEGGENKS